MKVNPARLRFTQDTIASHFKAPYANISLHEAVASIQTGKMSPNIFPSIRVFLHNGYMWSIDNRRLWVFRMAKCSKISVRITRMHSKHRVFSNRLRLEQLSRADFLPRVRGHHNVMPASAPDAMPHLCTKANAVEIQSAVPDAQSRLRFKTPEINASSVMVGSSAIAQVQSQTRTSWASVIQHPSLSFPEAALCGRNPPRMRMQQLSRQENDCRETMSPSASSNGLCWFYFPYPTVIAPLIGSNLPMGIIPQIGIIPPTGIISAPMGILRAPMGIPPVPMEIPPAAMGILQAPIGIIPAGAKGDELALHCPVSFPFLPNRSKDYNR